MRACLRSGLFFLTFVRAVVGSGTLFVPCSFYGAEFRRWTTIRRSTSTYSAITVR